MRKFLNNQIVRLEDKALARVVSYENGLYTVVNFNTMKKEVHPESGMKKIPKSLERRL